MRPLRVIAVLLTLALLTVYGPYVLTRGVISYGMGHPTEPLVAEMNFEITVIWFSWSLGMVVVLMMAKYVFGGEKDFSCEVCGKGLHQRLGVAGAICEDCATDMGIDA